MFRIKLRRFAQVFQFGWKDAKEIAQMEGMEKSQLAIFFDIFRCFRKYYISGYQYKKNQLWKLSVEDKRQLATRLGDENRFKDAWLDRYYRNWQFLDKYSGVKWETSQSKRTKRNEAYSKYYGFGKNCWTQKDVTFIFEHYSIGSLKIGNNCLFARGCDIDITGDLVIGDKVDILEGAKILTHAHDSYHLVDDSEIIPYSNRAYKTNLIIGNNVTICAHAVIMPGVKEIGENSIIQAGAIVSKKVPANTIFGGNPAKVILKMPDTIDRVKH